LQTKSSKIVPLSQNILEILGFQGFLARERLEEAITGMLPLGFSLFSAPKGHVGELVALLDSGLIASEVAGRAVSPF